MLAFGEAMSMLVVYKRHMGKGGNGKTESRKEQKLACCRGEQVRATYNLVDVHQRVVNHNGKLVGEEAISASDDEIAYSSLHMLGLRPGQQILKVYNALIVNAKTQ